VVDELRNSSLKSKSSASYSFCPNDQNTEPECQRTL
jgi:hypothetical protein